MAGQRRLQSEVVERGRAKLAGEHEELLHRLVGERLRLGELVRELHRRLDAGRLKAQEQRGKRLIYLVVEVPRDPGALLLLRGERGARGPSSLGIQALEHAPEGGVQPLDLLRLTAGIHRGLEVRAGP